MAYARVSHGGGAVSTTLNGAITSGATSAVIAAATGWPDGSTAPFYLVIDPGLATEEKILATSRTTLTLNTLTRGVDGTSAAAHASGATVVHCFTAVEADEANVAVNKTIGQVTTKGDLLAATASQVLSRLGVGADNTVLQAQSGQATGLAYGKIVTANITAANVTATELAANAVTTAKILDANVTTAKLADASITIAKFGAGLQPVQVCTSGTRPGSPTAGMTIFETDTKRYYGYDGAAWVFVDSLATGEDKVSVQSDVVTGGPTSGTATSTLATMVIAAKPFAYTLHVGAFWSALDSVVGDFLRFSIRVDGVSKGATVDRFSGGSQERRSVSIPTTTPVVVAANTASTVTVVAGRSSGSGTFTEEEPGVVTATMYRLNP